MKHFRLFLLTTLLTLFATVAMGQTYDTPANISEGSTYLNYSGAVDMSSDGEASYYTQVLYVGDANQGVSGLSVELGDSTGTEDLNVLVEFSHDRLNWNSISTAAIDAAAAGYNVGTIHDIGGSNLVEFDGALYMRLHFDGQTGNPAATVDWNLYLPKNTGAPLRGIGFVENRKTS